ncbi:MAG TPA: YlbF family regulator [Clostridiales bacterium]|nr:YlbF family regulator [Clostridiales bacterium]
MLKDTVSRTEIIKMAKDLGLALARSSEIIRYREAEKKMAEDPEACRLTRIFKETHKSLVKLQNDPNSTKEEIENIAARLEKADKDMKANPLIAEYYQAGAAFNNLIYQINQLLKFYCMEPGEDAHFGQQGGCGSCNGSCSR